MLCGPNPNDFQLTYTKIPGSNTVCPSYQITPTNFDPDEKAALGSDPTMYWELLPTTTAPDS